LQQTGEKQKNILLHKPNRACPTSLLITVTYQRSRIPHWNHMSIC